MLKFCKPWAWNQALLSRIGPCIRFTSTHSAPGYNCGDAESPGRQGAQLLTCKSCYRAMLEVIEALTTQCNRGSCLIYACRDVKKRNCHNSLSEWFLLLLLPTLLTFAHSHSKFKVRGAGRCPRAKYHRAAATGFNPHRLRVGRMLNTRGDDMKYLRLGAGLDCTLPALL